MGVQLDVVLEFETVRVYGWRETVSGIAGAFRLVDLVAYDAFYLVG